jgi:hypothetical protein
MNSKILNLVKLFFVNSKEIGKIAKSPFRTNQREDNKRSREEYVKQAKSRTNKTRKSQRENSLEQNNDHER